MSLLKLAPYRDECTKLFLGVYYIQYIPQVLPLSQVYKEQAPQKSETSQYTGNILSDADYRFYPTVIFYCRFYRTDFCNKKYFSNSKRSKKI